MSDYADFYFVHESHMEALLEAAKYFNSLEMGKNISQKADISWWPGAIEIYDGDSDSLIGSLRWHRDGYWVIDPELHEGHRG